MMRLSILATACAALFYAPAVFAQALDCPSAMSQLDMNLCAEREFDLADAALNDAYAQARYAMQGLDENLEGDLYGAEQALVQAQRAWIKFRDAACDAEGYLMRGGSAEPLLIFSCLVRLTEQRTEDLENLAIGAEG